MKFDASKEILVARLRDMDAAGAEGFEGLLADCLSEITGRSFCLVKSGPQGGSDVRFLRQDNLKVALEAKRHGAKTGLVLDLLKGKIFESAQLADPPDVWILAASRSVSADVTEALVKTGQDLGITAVVLDWPATKGTLPRMAVALCEVPDAIGRHLGADPALTDDLEEIRAHASYSAYRDEPRSGRTPFGPIPDVGLHVRDAAPGPKRTLTSGPVATAYGLTAVPSIIAWQALRAAPAPMPAVGPSILGLTPFSPATIGGFRPFV